MLQNKKKRHYRGYKSSGSWSSKWQNKNPGNDVTSGSDDSTDSIIYIEKNNQIHVTEPLSRLTFSIYFLAFPLRVCFSHPIWSNQIFTRTIKLALIPNDNRFRFVVKATLDRRIFQISLFENKNYKQESSSQHPPKLISRSLRSKKPRHHAFRKSVETLRCSSQGR